MDQGHHWCRKSGVRSYKVSTEDGIVYRRNRRKPVSCATEKPHPDRQDGATPLKQSRQESKAIASVTVEESGHLPPPSDEPAELNTAQKEEPHVDWSTGRTMSESVMSWSVPQLFERNLYFLSPSQRVLSCETIGGFNWTNPFVTDVWSALVFCIQLAPLLLYLLLFYFNKNM